MPKTPRTRAEIDCNPSYYDFLDGAPLAVWVKEFLLRNREFVLSWEPIQASTKSNYHSAMISIGNKYGVSLSRTRTPSQALRDQLHVGLRPVVQAIRTASDKDCSRLSSESRKTEKLYKTELSISIWPSSTKFSLDDGFTSPLLDLIEWNDPEDPQTYKDRIFLSLNLGSPVDRTLEMVSAILHANRTTPLAKRHFKKWKLYLMVYDLHTLGHNFTEIADYFSENIPEAEKLNDAKNVERYVDACRKLIDMGYKKYL